MVLENGATGRDVVSAKRAQIVTLLYRDHGRRNVVVDIHLLSGFAKVLLTSTIRYPFKPSKNSRQVPSDVCTRNLSITSRVQKKPTGERSAENGNVAVVAMTR